MATCEYKDCGADCTGKVAEKNVIIVGVEIIRPKPGQKGRALQSLI